MSSNQREIQRSDRRAQKERKTKRIIWIILISLIVILAIMKIFEFNVNSVKERFTDDDGNFSISEGVEGSNFPYNLDSSENVVIKNINNKIGILTPTTFTVINSADASAEYSFDHGYSNPVLESEGIYTVIYDRGQSKYRLDTTSDSVYSETIDNSILCCSLTKGGTVAVASTSEKKLCEINVFTRSLKNISTIEISEGYIIDIAISDDAKKVACAIVNSENANLITSVYIYDVSKGECIKTVELPQGSIADLKYSGSNIITLGDTYLGVIKGGEYKSVYEQGTISATTYCYTPAGELVVAFGSYSNSTENTIALVKPNGRVKSELTFNGIIKDISASSNIVSVLTGNGISGIVFSSGEVKENIETDDSVKSVLRIGSTVYVQKQSIIDRCDINAD